MIKCISPYIKYYSFNKPPGNKNSLSIKETEKAVILTVAAQIGKENSDIIRGKTRSETGQIWALDRFQVNKDVFFFPGQSFRSEER